MNAKRDDKVEQPMCKCEKNHANAPHACPYQQEINNSTDETYCTCCGACEQECRNDI